VATACVERRDLAMPAIPGKQSLAILALPALVAMHEPEINAAIKVGRVRDRPLPHECAYSAATFSGAASVAAFSSAAFASTSSTMCSTMSAPAIVWSVLPAR
jgi:hypothetical protein